MPDNPPICVGIAGFAGVVPSWPRELSPAAQTVPLLLSTRLWALPAATATAPVTPDIGTGVDREVSVPSPSCPLVFMPQADTVPSDLIANETLRPAAIATTDESPETCTGDSRWIVVPSPS